MSIPTINIANTILLKFADSPRALMSLILLRDERRAPASGLTMNPHKIEVPCCIERISAAGIKEGNLCLREKYITAVPGEDTETVESAGV
jgi:hypothetical protein